MVRAEMAEGNEAFMSEPARPLFEDDGKIFNMRGREATIEDLYTVEGRAEIVGGRLVLMGFTPWLPAVSAIHIFDSLREYGRRTKGGYAVPESVPFIVSLPNRQSFAP